MLCIEKSPKNKSAAVESVIQAPYGVEWDVLPKKKIPKTKEWTLQLRSPPPSLSFCSASLLRTSPRVSSKTKNIIGLCEIPNVYPLNQWNLYRFWCVFLRWKIHENPWIHHSHHIPSPNWPKSETRAPVWIIALHPFEGATLLFLALAIPHWPWIWKMGKALKGHSKIHHLSIQEWSQLTRNPWYSMVIFKVKKHWRWATMVQHINGFRLDWILWAYLFHIFSQHLLKKGKSSNRSTVSTNPIPSWLWSFCALIDAWYAASLRIEWPWDQRILFHPGPCGFVWKCCVPHCTQWLMIIYPY